MLGYEYRPIRALTCDNVATNALESPGGDGLWMYFDI
jgi:hypothetical protein